MIRKAKLNDVGAIYDIIESFARKGDMLMRPLAEIYDNVRDFLVYETDGRIAGAGSLHVWGADIGEIRSLAVSADFTGRGIGKSLVDACIEEARSLGIKRVFALTYKTAFFEKLGFSVVDKLILPQKIWGDCVRCSKFPSCDETAVMIEV
ncbi:MAG: N-acetyltransferase [Deltaproteobacteria bacterium]|nr:N-acetyltransferase [Deltaproteobacteria bacterium]